MISWYIRVLEQRSPPGRRWAPEIVLTVRSESDDGGRSQATAGSRKRNGRRLPTHHIILWPQNLQLAMRQPPVRATEQHSSHSREPSSKAGAPTLTLSEIVAHPPHRNCGRGLTWPDGAEFAGAARGRATGGVQSAVRCRMKEQC
jgi:hypothetical protein